jgi:hypothetical protein
MCPLATTLEVCIQRSCRSSQLRQQISAYVHQIEGEVRELTSNGSYIRLGSGRTTLELDGDWGSRTLPCDCEWLASFDVENGIGELNFGTDNSQCGGRSEESEELHVDNEVRVCVMMELAAARRRQGRTRYEGETTRETWTASSDGIREQGLLTDDGLVLIVL